MLSHFAPVGILKLLLLSRTEKKIEFRSRFVFLFFFFNRAIKVSTLEFHGWKELHIMDEHSGHILKCKINRQINVLIRKT